MEVRGWREKSDFDEGGEEGGGVVFVEVGDIAALDVAADADDVGFVHHRLRGGGRDLSVEIGKDREGHSVRGLRGGRRRSRARGEGDVWLGTGIHNHVNGISGLETVFLASCPFVCHSSICHQYGIGVGVHFVSTERIG